MKSRKKQPISGIFILIAFMVFILLFTYSSLNLKNIDYGYRMQKLIQQQKTLMEEIDKLRAAKAQLLTLDRIEQVVMNKLGYRYPKSEQFIKIFEVSE
jgi:hypothetical protein